MRDARGSSYKIERVRLLSTRAWMWVLFVGFSAGAWLGWSESPTWVLVVSLLFALIGAVAVLGLGTIYISTDAIWTTTLTGRYGLRWNEVILVEFNSLGIVFHGHGKRLVIVGPELWSQKERDTAIPFLNATIAEKNIRHKRSNRADWLYTKNARFRAPDA